MISSHTLRTFIRGLNILSCASLRGALFWFAFFAILLGPAVLAGDALAQQDRLEKLEIVTSNGTHEFSVEVMRNGLQRERGLMFRRFLDENRGMLFDFETERPVMMWMKNTYLPLDMVFIGRFGKVVGIAENAVPLSEKVISSGVSTFAVLEVNAGTAARIGLRIGDSIHHPIFGH
jgi:uncharacterized protein